jgi:hypothetical protein
MRGRPARATAAQRAEVERLAAEGAPIRAIAEQVFGDLRYRGRVERILRRPDTASKMARPGRGAARPAAQPEEAPPFEATATIRPAFDREIDRIAAGLAEPSPAELRTLLDIQRRLEAREAVERLNALTRQPDRLARPKRSMTQRARKQQLAPQ